MSTPTVGKLCGEGARRDAIHVAIAPVVAGQILKPGERIGFCDDGRVRKDSNGFGIVDPFLKNPVLQYQRFWAFLDPASVMSLRHEWEHKDFPGTDAKTGMSPSEIWLRAYAMKLKPYDEPNEAYLNLLRDLNIGQLFGYGTDLHSREDVEDEHQLIEHAEIVLGKKFNLDTFSFSCSC